MGVINWGIIILSIKFIAILYISQILYKGEIVDNIIIDVDELNEKNV